MMFLFFILGVVFAQGTAPGYKLNTDNSYVYVNEGCETGCITLDAQTNTYKVNKDILPQPSASTAWPTFTIEAIRGHQIDFDLATDTDANGGNMGININLKIAANQPEGIAENVKVKYSFTLPCTKIQYSISIENDGTNFDEITYNFKKCTPEEKTAARLIYIKGQSKDASTPAINHKVVYELAADAETINFNEYTKPVFQNINGADTLILSNIPVKTRFETAVHTNLGKQNINLMPVDITVSDNDKTVYYYFSKDTTDYTEKWFDDILLQITETEKPKCQVGVDCVSGYYYFSEGANGRKFVYSDKILNTNTNYITADNGVYKINKDLLLAAVEWDKNYIQIEGGDVFEFTFDQQLPINCQIEGGNVRESTEKFTVKLVFPTANEHMGVNFYQCDGKLNDVEVLFKKHTTTSLQKVYMKGGCNSFDEFGSCTSQFTNPINYVLDYERDASETTINFDLYVNPIWQESNVYIIKFKSFGSIIFDEPTRTNVGRDNSYSNPSDFIEEIDGTKYVHMFSDQTLPEDGWNWFKTIYLTRVDESQVEYYTGYQKSGNTYQYSEKITNAEGESLVNENGNKLYEITSDMMAPGAWVLTTIIPGGDTELYIHFDAEEENNQKKVLLETKENIDVSKTIVSVFMKPTDIENDFQVKQGANTLEYPIILVFETEEDEESETGLKVVEKPVYVKGARDVNPTGTETVRYQLEYDVDNIEELVSDDEEFFKHFKPIQLQQYQYVDGQVKLEIPTIFFKDQYPEFDNIKTNLIANEWSGGSNMPVEIKTKCILSSETECIQYTLKLKEDHENPRYYYISSNTLDLSDVPEDEKASEKDFSKPGKNDKPGDKPGNKPNDNPSGASSIVICFMIFMLALLF